LSKTLVALSEDLASTVEHAARSVVAVHARRRFDSSGVQWAAEVIVTADHAIRTEEEIRVTAPDGSEHRGEVAGRDPGTDLAVLRVKGLNLPVPARAAALRPGNVILVVGRLNQSASVAAGVLSNISGPTRTWRGGRLDQVVRLDVALHPAASGGAVVDAAGNLVGIATPALSRVSVFAIPVATVDRVTQSLLAHGRIPRGYLGVGLQPIALPEHLKSSHNLSAAAGLIAISVDGDAPAGRAGMAIGDVLVELGGRAVHRPEDVQEVLDAESIGKKLSARILRGGAARELEITIGERPGRP
jgi:S1-C subfamily serine protease